jgi:hypothetical protein
MRIHTIRFLSILAISMITGMASAQTIDDITNLTPLPEFTDALHSEWREARDNAIARVINPDDYVCGPTDLEYWIDGVLSMIVDFGSFNSIVKLGALDWPFYYAVLFDQDDSDESFGVDGKQTMEFLERHRDNQRFWDIDSDNIMLQAMHGSYVADDDKMVPLVKIMYGVNEGLARLIVNYVQRVLEADPGMGYDFPLLSFDAFAISGEAEPPGSIYYGVPDKIVIGDGFLMLLGDVGLGDQGPDWLHAHEFAHHVQFDLGVSDVRFTPEENRRFELMADAFGAYYSAHSRGATFQAKRIIDAYGSSYLFGDCYFYGSGHHGTPNQREAAARWGVSVVEEASNQGHILPSAQMVEDFDAVLPDIVAPDAP